MPRNPFQFKHFSLSDDGCAMKLGTDAVLLGAWTKIPPDRRPLNILDIGTGSGVLALMLAQRTAETGTMITAVEIDRAAGLTAVRNFEQSPWSARMCVVHGCISRFEPENDMDLVVCNPPFFHPHSNPASPALADARHLRDAINSDGIEEQLNNESPRETARRSTQLSRQTLFATAASVMRTEASFQMVIPADQEQQTIALANESGMRTARITHVRPLPDQPFKRVLLEFMKTEKTLERLTSELTLESVHHQYTDQYREMTEDFYLHRRR